MALLHGCGEIAISRGDELPHEISVGRIT
jgi:hypothetical protein